MASWCWREEALLPCAQLSTSNDNCSFLLPTLRARANLDVYGNDMQVTHMSALVFSLQITAVYEKKKKKVPLNKEAAFCICMCCFLDGGEPGGQENRREKWKELTALTMTTYLKLNIPNSDYFG